MPGELSFMVGMLFGALLVVVPVIRLTARECAVIQSDVCLDCYHACEVCEVSGD